MDDDETLRYLLQRLDAVAERNGISAETPVSAQVMLAILVEARDELAAEIDRDRADRGLPPIPRPWGCA